ncbi:MAG: LacI family DNA-binding transcriptional regulator [Flavisolibacter sp.]|nr:LacI family DNA-binding transcriptional regulator [Flavisolibacter sp.]
MSYRQLTLKDIAKELNTSVATVSRALKNHPSISDQMKKKVMQLATELNYHPNSIAVSLLKNRSYTIGVIVPEIAHNFYSIVMEGIENAAISAGYNVLFCMSKESKEREVNVLSTLLHSRIDGLLIAPSKETTDYKHLETLFNREMPLIFFDRHCAEIPTSKVLVDDYKGAFKAVDHLASVGCKRIAHIAGPQNLSNSQQRLSGYIDALKALNLKQNDNYIVTSDLTKESVRTCTTRLLEMNEKPDAIFAYNSFLAFESMLIVKDKGLKIPDDIAFVGFANEPMISYIEPSLTTVLQPAYRMGQEAVKLFFNQLNSNAKKFAPETLILETKLLVKASSRRKT